MTENTPYSDLKEAIAKLEKEQAFSWQLLKDESRSTYDKLNPFNLLKRSFTNFVGSSDVRNDLFGLIMPLITGFLVKKASAGTRRRQVVKNAGILLLDGLGRYLTSNPELLKTVARFITSVFGRTKTIKAPQQ